jgi:tetratricopeptide (TPR) repeat protein
MYRGVYYLQQEKLPEAIKELEKAMNLDEQNAYAHYYAGHAYLVSVAKRIILRVVPGLRPQGALECGSLMPPLHAAQISVNQQIAVKAQASLRTPRASPPIR